MQHKTYNTSETFTFLCMHVRESECECVSEMPFEIEF